MAHFDALKHDDQYPTIPKDFVVGKVTLIHDIEKPRCVKYENRYGMVLLNADDNLSLYKLLKDTRADLHGNPFYVFHERTSIHTQRVYKIKEEHVVYVQIQTSLKTGTALLAGIETYIKTLDLYKDHRGVVLSELGVPRFRHINSINKNGNCYVLEVVTCESKPNWYRMVVVTVTGELIYLFSDYSEKEKIACLIVYLSMLRDIQYY